MFDYLFIYYYKESDSLFKTLYDKYARNDLYCKVIESGIQNIRKNKNQFIFELTSDLKWSHYNNIKELKADEEMPIENIDFEKKSLEYLKINLVGMKLQMISIYLITSLLVGFAVLYPIKRVRRNPYSKMILFFPGLNLVFFNTYIIISSLKYNSENKFYLEEKYKRQIEKYNLIFN